MNLTIKSTLRFIVLCLVLGNLFFASWYVQNHDINFSSDIARDFLLLKELDQKKLVLIGPRSSVSGLFHGPLWLYLNYPAYVLGHGNPVVVGWHWIFLIAVFLISAYIAAKKLFGEATALIFVLTMSSYLIHHANGLFNPHGALFLLPIFFYLFVRYVSTFKILYLVALIMVLGGLIQFQMAVGLPFLILSLIYIIPTTLRHKHRQHLLFWPLIVVPVSTFLLFDLKHQFILTQTALRHVGTASDTAHSFWYFVADRIRIMTTGTEFLRYGIAGGSIYTAIACAVLLLLQLLDGIHRRTYGILLYFYIGFFAVSLLNRYALLYFYVFPLFPLPFLIWSSLVTSKRYRWIFLGIFGIVYATNTMGAVAHIRSADANIGKSLESWKFLSTVASDVFSGPEKDFGYFVYSPDILGYGPKYALEYMASLHPTKTAHNFEKKPVTHLVIAPPPRDNPDMKAQWWKEHVIGITPNPVAQKTYPNGYTIETYALTPEDMAVGADPNNNPGILFR